MIKLSFNELLSKAREFKAKKMSWHFHLMAKDCMFNPFKGKYLLFLEEENIEEFYSEFEQKPLKEAEELANLMYGKEFLEKTRAEKELANPELERLVARAKELNDKGIDWHHHHLHPNCKFNQHKGKHTIVLEDKEKNKIWQVVFDYYPKTELKAIERLFYGKQ